MSAAEVAVALGNAHREGRNWRCRCPVHGGHSLVLADGRDALLVKCWAGCNARDVLAELRRLRLSPGCSEQARPAPMTVRSDRDEAARRCAMARSVRDAARDARGSPVAAYLVGRLITIALRRPDGTHGPAMIARVDGLDGELIGVHRTWLDRDADGIWRRRDRASLGPIAGGAVRLATAAETLTVAEGIETALAAMQATGLPAWAALSTSGMRAVMLPRKVRHVAILADNDKNGAGQRAAEAAAQRFCREGRGVSVWISPHVGTDANDLLLFRGEAGTRHAA